MRWQDVLNGATMNKRHPGRFGHIVAEIIQDIVGVGVVAINGIGLVIMAAVLAKYVPYKHFYHVVGNVVVYACLAAAFIGKLVSPATRGMSRSSRRRW